MTNNNEKGLNEDLLLILIKAIQTSENFKQFKTFYSQASKYSKKNICCHN